MKPTNLLKFATAFVGVLALTVTLRAQEAATNDNAAADLAKKLANPVASLISVPIQNNWDFGVGSANAMRYTVNIQPVIPISLSSNWNLITRTIVPVVYAESTEPAVGAKAGLGDIVQSFWASPKAPTEGGLVWGAGVVGLYPTGTGGLSGHNWGAGPTALVLKQENGWTYGMLANHLWSIPHYRGRATLYMADASDGGGAGLSATFLQPFLSFSTKTFTTFGLNTETTYDWAHHQWTVPLNASVSQLVKIGGAPVQFQLGPKFYAAKPSGGPDWGMRFTLTLLFPK